MKTLIAALLIPLLVSMPQLAFAQRGEQAILTQTVASTSPAIINPAATACGPNTPCTSSAIDTTGAKVIALVISFYSPVISCASTDNKSNGTATTLTTYNAAVGSGSVQIQYWLSPTVGAGHTFTVTCPTGLSDSYVGFSVEPIGGIAGAFVAGSDSGASGTTTCQAGSITPSGSNVVVIAGVGGGAAWSGLSIGSSYTLDSSTNYNGNNYGVGVAHIVQATGGATNPQWSTSGGDSVCDIAAFE